jgi:hypothetical protein
MNKNQNLVLTLSLIFIIIALLWYYYKQTKSTPAPAPVTAFSAPDVPFLPMSAGLTMGPISYSPSDYLYGWENYPKGPAWSLGDRVPYAQAKLALGGHFGGGVYSPRDPILQSKLSGVNIGDSLYSVGGMGGNGHW